MAKFEIYKDGSGEFRARLKAGNGETVATSEGYSSKDGATNWTGKLAEWASGADVEDLT